MANLDTAILEGKLDRYRGRLKQAWATLTDDDIQHAEGSVDRLVGIIKEKTGQTRKQIERRLERMT